MYVSYMGHRPIVTRIRMSIHRFHRKFLMCSPFPDYLIRCIKIQLEFSCFITNLIPLISSSCNHLMKQSCQSFFWASKTKIFLSSQVSYRRILIPHRTLCCIRFKQNGIYIILIRPTEQITQQNGRTDHLLRSKLQLNRRKRHYTVLLQPEEETVQNITWS